MIKERFYPRDIELLRDVFDFTPLIGSSKPKFMDFNTRNDLIDFLKAHGVVLTDKDNPLQFLKCTHPSFGVCRSVVQHSLLGWSKDSFEL